MKHWGEFYHESTRARKTRKSTLLIFNFVAFLFRVFVVIPSNLVFVTLFNLLLDGVDRLRHQDLFWADAVHSK
jgi:hypothetical protein